MYVTSTDIIYISVVTSLLSKFVHIKLQIYNLGARILTGLDLDIIYPIPVKILFVFTTIRRNDIRVDPRTLLVQVGYKNVAIF